MKTFIFFPLVILNSVCIFNTHAQSSLYDLNTIQKIEVFFTQSDWDYQMDTAKSGSEGYIFADSIRINDVLYDSVGVKYKGNSSYNSSNIKNPIHIALDEFKNQDYQGYEDIKLGNGYADPSMIREVMAYNILSNYMDCPLSNFAQLYINGEYIGIYSNDESINKKFCSEHFYSSDNTFVKCNPITNPSPATKSNLKFIPSVDSTGYYNFYELKSDAGWNDLVNLCDSVTNGTNDLGISLDIDRIIWMLAFNNVSVNLDSYSGVFSQNYYLYKDNTNRFNPIIWDLNMSMGGFPYLGSGTTSMGTLTNTNMQQLSPTIHSGDPNWPLINDILNNPTYKRMYIAHMKTITEEFFADNTYESLVTQLQTTIDTAVQSDVNKFYSYSQFQNGLTENVVVGSYTVPGISNLMDARTTYLQSTTEFGYSAPSILTITASSSSPVINSTFDITANVSNTNSNGVYLGYRFDYTDKFTRIEMYDDGLHNDGSNGDNIYGTSLSMLSAEMQYYIYAENDNAGIFSPQRAEHEFHSLSASIQTAQLGDVVINEFLASNQNDAIDEQGQHDDWIEIYNLTDNALSLSGLYLSDDVLNLTKYSFPASTFIPANGYVVIWADQDSSSSSELHCNFKLGSTGDRIIFSNNLGEILDSISFGIQTTDVSIGRCPDGIGEFTVQAPSTYNAPNCYSGIDEQELIIQPSVFPNPSNGNFTVQLSQIGNYSLELTDLTGKIIEMTAITQDNMCQFQSDSLSNGIYLLKIISMDTKYKSCSKINIFQ